MVNKPQFATNRGNETIKESESFTICSLQPLHFSALCPKENNQSSYCSAFICFMTRNCVSHRLLPHNFYLHSLQLCLLYASQRGGSVGDIRLSYKNDRHKNQVKSPTAMKVPPREKTGKVNLFLLYLTEINFYSHISLIILGS